MKTVIFIDGENLRYSLRSLKLREKDIHWTKFLNHCLQPGDVLVRAYWYQAEKINDPKIYSGRVRKLIEQSFAGNREEKEAEVGRLIEKATAWREEQIRRYKRKLDFFDNLSTTFPEIEMVRKGILKIDPLKEIYLGEKGLDVALSIGMVERQEYCDKIILISGDMDYAEAIRFVKNKLKRVDIVRLFSGNPPTNRSVSRQLRELADRVVDCYESEIKESMLS